MKKLLCALILACMLATQLAAQITHSVALSWTASTTSGATYNVYRLTGACPAALSLAAFTKLTSTPITALSYTDSAVTAGTTYCYAVTALVGQQESQANGALQVYIPLFTANSAPVPPGAFTSSQAQ